MKVFELYWSWYEEYCPYLFSRENKTEEEFQQDVNGLINNHGQEYVNRQDSWIGASDLIQFVVEKIPELGYKEIKSDYKYGFFGNYILKDEVKQNLEDKFIQILDKNLLNNIIKHNKKVEKKLNKQCKKLENKNKNENL